MDFFPQIERGLLEEPRNAATGARLEGLYSPMILIRMRFDRRPSNSP